MDCLVVIELSKYYIHFGIVCVLEMQMIRRQKCPFPAIRLEQNNNKADTNITDFRTISMLVERHSSKK